ncbi:MAG TPA: hypothetical protein VF591_07485 [Pyrinomonadaceae bacterium]|jgi:hypothetical protein
MSRKLNPVPAVIALAFLLAAASAASAQPRRLGPATPVDVRASAAAQERVATLGCCKCLGGTNTLDLSTVSSNRWTVNNGAPAVFQTAVHPLWNLNPGPAAWVSTAAGGGTGNVPAGIFEYRLDFFVPKCTIGQEVTLTGNYGGDDDVDVFLDDATGQAVQQNPFFLSRCAGGWCFNTPQKSLQAQSFTRAVGPGPHTLIVKVTNSGGPSGMFVNATLNAACRRE